MVAVQKHLENAPIQEAVIDFRIRRGEPMSESEHESLNDVIRSEYPISDQLHTSQFNLRVNKPTEPYGEFEHQIRGYKYTSKDKLFVVQFRNDGFTLSRLAPYETWEATEREARRLWQEYARIAKPSAIVRIAVRYINRIVLQFVDHKIDLEDYFLIVPTVPPELPQTTVSLLSQQKLHDAESGAAANVSVSTSGAEEGGLPVIFDIDVFKGGEFPTEGQKHWEMLEDLRQLKNRIFFHSVTEKTLELFR